MMDVHKSSLIVLCVATLGCRQSSLDTVPVTGHITYQGKPLAGGTVMFRPAGIEKGRPGMAKIKDGNFIAATLENAPGLIAGEYQVSVVYLERPILEAAPAKSSGVPSKIPVRYNQPQTSGLELHVPAGSNPIKFDIDLKD